MLSVACLACVSRDLQRGAKLRALRRGTCGRDVYLSLPHLVRSPLPHDACAGAARLGA